MKFANKLFSVAWDDNFRAAMQYLPDDLRLLFCTQPDNFECLTIELKMKFANKLFSVAWDDNFRAAMQYLPDKQNHQFLLLLLFLYFPVQFV